MAYNIAKLQIPSKTIYQKRISFQPNVEHSVSIIAFPAQSELTPEATQQLKVLAQQSRNLLLQTISIAWVYSELDLPVLDRYWRQLFGRELPTHRVQVMVFRYSDKGGWRKTSVDSKVIVALFINLSALDEPVYTPWVRFLGSFLLLQVERARVDSTDGIEWLMLSLYSAYKSLMLRRRETEPLPFNERSGS